MLGVGDFYYELGVQVIEVCMANNQTNGGIMKLDELYSKLLKSRKQEASLYVSWSDMKKIYMSLMYCENVFFKGLIWKLLLKN